MRKKSAFTAIVVGVGIFAFTIGVRMLAGIDARVAYEQKVDLYLDASTTAVTTSLDRNFDALRNIDVAISHAAAVDVSTTEAFHSYVSGTNIIEEFDALRGIAVFDYVVENKLDDMLERYRSDVARTAQGYPPLTLQPLADRPDHIIVTMFAPLDIGHGQLGVDMQTRDRNVTFAYAIDNHSVTVSAPFRLQSGEQLVTVVYPIYADEFSSVPSGFLGTALSVDIFVAQLQDTMSANELEFSLTDMGVESEISSSSTSEFLGGNIAVTDRYWSRDMSVGGRIWRLRLRPIAPLPSLFNFDFVTILAGLCSVLASLLLFRSSNAAAVLSAEVARRTKQLDDERRDALHKAKYDPLTGLLNRRGLEIEHQNSCIRNPSSNPTLVAFDLDNFKQINDTLGHAAGDELLCAFATKLASTCPKGTLLARFGGDEFCALVFAPLERARYFADTVLDWSKSPITVDEKVIRFGVSVGLATDEDDNIDLAEIIVNADIALYSAKEKNRGSIEVFSDSLRQKLLETKLLADDIRRGIDNDEFVPFFQTQHDAKTHDITGIEALVRWEHPERGVLPPIVFLDTAQKMGVLKSIDKRTLELTAAAVARMEKAGIEIPKYSVNVSLDRLTDSYLTPSVDDLPRTRAQLCFEILESDFLDEPSDELLFVLDFLRDMNVGLEVDDFGSGRASIIALKHLSPDGLKIDKGLIQPLLEDPSQKQLVTLIVEMGKAMGMSVTAEGVETLEHATALADMGVDTLQGYYFSKPCSETDLKTQHGRHAAA